MSLEALDIPFALGAAGRYADPANPAEPLPVVYGALASPARGGALGTVEIDRARAAFLVADHPVEAIDAVYVDGEARLSGFTAFPDADFDGLGRIALVRFDAPPAGRVTVDARGRRGAAGALLTDAVDVIEDFLALAGVARERLDATLAAEARRFSLASGYRLEGAIDRARTPREWLALWMLHVLGDAFVTEEGRLGLRLAGAPLTDFELSADLEGRDALEAAWTLETASLLTRPLLRYRYNWAQGDYEASDETPASAASLLRFGREYARELALPWARSEAHAGRLRGLLLDRLGAPRWTVDLADQSRALLALGVGDRFLLTHGAAPQADAARRVYRILSISKDLETGVVRALGEDLGAVAGAPVLYDGGHLYDAAVRHGADVG